MVDTPVEVGRGLLCWLGALEINGQISAYSISDATASRTPSRRIVIRVRMVARLVADGATSKEAAGRLFLSPRTIDAHVRNIFKKLEVTSRSQLRALRTHLPADPNDVHPAH